MYDYDGGISRISVAHAFHYASDNLIVELTLTAFFGIRRGIGIGRMVQSVHLIPLIPVMAGLIVGLPAQADMTSPSPVAIIEDIKAEGVDFELLEFLSEGATIKLAKDETLKLAYLRSCIVEEFQGGIVTVGQTQSKLAGGVLRYRENVDCGGGSIIPTERQAQDVAGIVIRAPNLESDQPLVLVYATTPMFTFAEPVKELIIERMDPGSKEEHRFSVEGKWLDLADKQVQLAAGGLYRVTAGRSSTLLRISRKATASSSSVISRLVGF